MPVVGEIAETERLPEWSAWRGDAEPPYSVGVEEELMLLDPAAGWGLAHRGEEALEAIGDAMGGRACGELHRATLEIQTGPRLRVGDAVDELRELRGQLAELLAPLGLRVAAAGTHPFHDLDTTQVSSGERYVRLRGLLRGLARREPTFALHVHVAAPDAEAGMRLFRALRAHLPLLVALSGSSPYWRGRDSGFASSRTFLFQAFPRTGLPRGYGSYAEWVGAVDLLIRTGAIADPTYLWWDVRPQPKLGTVEVRVMDAQSRVGDTATLVALVQCLARFSLEEGEAGQEARRPPAPGGEVLSGDLGAAGPIPEVGIPDEVLHENRFLAARDGVAGELIDPAVNGLRPVPELAAELLARLRPHAEALECVGELDRLRELVQAPGATRQRALVAAAGGDASVLVAALADEFLD